MSTDGRRLVLSYHGGDTTGADWFRVRSDSRLSRRGMAGLVHGSVAPVGAGFVAATGTDLIELDRDGRVVGHLEANARNVHLMDFAVDGGRPLLYVSSCGERPSLRRLDLARDRVEVLPSGGFCGVPLAVHRDRLLLAATTVGRNLGYPRGAWPPRELRLFDLADADAGGRRVASGVPLDALVLR